MSNINSIRKIFDESVSALEKFSSDSDSLESVIKAAEAIVKCCRSGGKILVFGNGGSAADSQHMAAELIVRFEKERRSIPCISLTTDTSILTAASNDYSFDDVFSRQVESLAKTGDLVVGISTSGRSENVRKAIKLAGEKEAFTVVLTGRDGGDLSPLADVSIIVREEITARIQEVHAAIIHIICKLVEDALSG